MRVLIVDDELPARRELARIVAGVPGAEVVASEGTAVDALATLGTKSVDLAFLDIHMPGMSGLELAAAVLDRESPPHVAFVTAHGEHALEAFEQEALDYIVKPPSPERVARLIERVRGQRVTPPAIETLQRSAPPGSPPLLLAHSPGSARKLLLKARDVLYAQADDELLFLVTAGGRWLSNRTLAELEADLGAHRFVRTHRSFLVNLDRVRELEPDGAGWTLHLDTGAHHVPASRRHWPEVKRRIEGG